MSPELRRLHADRPRRPFVNWSLRAFLLIILASWWGGGFRPQDFLDGRRVENLRRFLGEIRPWPLQDASWDWSVAARWAADLWAGGGAAAVLATLAISVAAMALAGFASTVSSPLAARNFARPKPFLDGGRPAGRAAVIFWRSVVMATRSAFVLLRSIPEYVWAFLLLGLLGATAWPLVLALALHNAGILGKLNAEVIENSDRKAPGALRALGARRVQIALGGLVPIVLPRFLLYFFYRWETCVREATVLGMLGTSSLGFVILEARARNRYDELFFFIVLGALLVLAGDLVSAAVRRAVR